MEFKLSKKELLRYNRHLMLSDFNIEGQLKLKNSKVLVVGAGGLGSPLILYLAAAGIGTLGIIDFDVVDESNLQRQVLYDTSHVGLKKVEIARQKIRNLNPHISINVYDEALTSQNALDIIREYDVVADGTDNFPTRYLVNDACVILDKPNVYASIYKFEGQLSVFNYVNKEGERGPNYRDLYPQPPLPGLVPNCAEGGVLGVLAGIMGSMQANEVIKIATQIGDPLSGRLFLFDSHDFSTRIVKISKSQTPIIIDTLVDYDEFCGVEKDQSVEQIKNSAMKEITVDEFSNWSKTNKDFQLIDVREPYEREIVHLGGTLIPMNTIPYNIDKIDKDKDVVVYCRSGKRSADIILFLQEQHGFNNLINLKGGVLDYVDKIDPTLTKY